MLRNFKTALMFGGSALCAVFVTAEAEARLCDSNNDYDTGCWKYVTGANMGQLAMGRNQNGDGIACAVDAEAIDAWGGSLTCFAATAAPSGFYEAGYAGERIGSGLFNHLDATKRIASVAIETDKTTNTNVVIHVLRSDGRAYHATVTWPIPQGANPEIIFGNDVGTPANARALSPDDSNGFLLVNSSNQKFTWQGLGYTSVGTDSSTVLSAGYLNESTVLLWGSNGNSVQLREFPSLNALPNLPQPLTGATSNANTSFVTDAVGNTAPAKFPGYLGPRQYPLSVTGTSTYEYVWAVLPGNCGGANIPCIYRSRRTHTGTTWSSWSLKGTNWMYDPSLDSAYPMPTTIQDGFAMHGRFDEIWVIAGYDHLRAWIP